MLYYYKVAVTWVLIVSYSFVDFAYILLSFVILCFPLYRTKLGYKIDTKL